MYDQARAPKVETNDTYGAEEEEDKAEVEDANVYYGEVSGRVVTYCAGNLPSLGLEASRQQPRLRICLRLTGMYSFVF